MTDHNANGFNGDTTSTLKEIILHVFAKGINKQTKFNVIDCPSAYNAILGRPWIHDMKAVPSTYHQKIKFPSPWGVQEIISEKKIARECYKITMKAKLQEVKYPDWLANVVVVQKKNVKWRVCIDFTDLNKACPKDPFPLPHIDAMIKMHTEDQENTTFMTDKGIYYYKVMSFGLKNAGSTYQGLVTMMFKEHLGRTIQVYIDNMLVKSERSHDHIQHLKQSFDILRQYKMKLNPTKCSFEVRAGKFLGYMNHGFDWTEAQEKALQDVKQYMVSPPLLTKPVEGESLQLYLAVSHNAVSVVLLREDDQQQRPIYYVSKSFLYAETRPELTGRLAKWSIYLCGFDLEYKAKTAIKSQALADFIAEFSPRTEPPSHNEVNNVTIQDNKPWILHVDGSSNVRGSRLGVVLKSSHGGNMVYSIRCEFKTTNNEAEYETLITRLDIAHNLGARHLHVRTYPGSAFNEPTLESIPIIHLTIPTIEAKVEVQMNEGDYNWLLDIWNYLKHDQLPDDKMEAQKTRSKSSRYTIFEDQLYRRCTSGLILRCITSYYWPTLREDAIRYVQRCDACQRHSSMSHLPSEPLHSVLIPWPFMQWVMDIVGKLPPAPGQKVFLLVLTDYFSKRIEAAAFSQISVGCKIGLYPRSQDGAKVEVKGKVKVVFKVKPCFIVLVLLFVTL
ncbi:hypothetical protein OSB04_025958 [Centaurea solstitialis]|uniref:Uncharacterized protein n=1 Tax=Centaurea solstitialis TaxID=347529 RepID=A0AA38T0M0_9ASTR|nr:hypothetical protein OSB04_025958 [Centaurea solstitialis]